MEKYQVSFIISLVDFNVLHIAVMDNLLFCSGCKEFRHIVLLALMPIAMHFKYQNSENQTIKQTNK